MTVKDTRNLAATTDPIVKAPATSRRRRTLAILHDRGASITETDLAAQLAAAEHDKPVIDVTQDEHDRRLADLIHAHLPILEAAGLIIRHREKDHTTVTTTHHPVLYDATFRLLSNTDPDTWERIASVLADTRRQLVLNIIHDRETPINRRSLARQVAARQTNIDEANPSHEVIETVLISLHHVHLPKLQQAGLLDYDPEAGTVMAINSDDGLWDRIQTLLDNLIQSDKYNPDSHNRIPL